MNRNTILAAAGVVALACGGCGSFMSAPVESTKTEAAKAAAARPATPPDIQAAAEAALGTETDVLAFGNLARTDKQQIFAVNRLKSTPQGVMPGTLVSRAVVIENDGGKWKELFRCDEHLQNPKGFLGGTPLAPVAAWRIQFEQHDDKGLEMYFTPLAKPAGGYIETTGVRWNPELKLYESLDRTYEHFLGETRNLESPESQAR
ncbi:MAG TPA: hypothetical protein VNV84_02540 [Candidatus Acidoferrales bacterium]|nr:hypothetical protein [Candidatus Acidoferrales bacterium]